jgi:hypothetical protein
VIQNINFTPPALPAGSRPSYLDDFDGVLGVELMLHVQFLDRIYPEAQFILALGDLDAWLSELKDTQGLMHPVLLDTLTQMTGQNKKDLINRKDAQLGEIYRDCCKQVQTYFQDQPSKLLTLPMISEMGSETSWKTLCTFLGVRTINAPFFFVRPKWKIQK